MTSIPLVSCARRARPPALRRRVAGGSLRARLLAALIGLLAVVCLVIGTVTVATAHHVLLDRLDDRLIAADQRASQAAGKEPRPREEPSTEEAGPGPDFLGAPGQSAGTLAAHIVAGQVEKAGWLDTQTGVKRAVPAAQEQVLERLPADHRPHTRDLGSLGTYRLIATTGQQGDVLVTGLPLADVEGTTYLLAGVVAGVAMVGLLAAAGAGAVIVRRTLRPLTRVAATAARVTELPLDRGEVVLAVRVPEADTDPRTEVGQVGAALNRMLSHVGAALAARHASETRVRQFLADASHELRTPLAAIRGYAELTRRGRETVPPDLAHAMRRVESEATRMTTLVDDLLLLARLDSGRPLNQDAVDLSRVLVDAVSDAHAAGPEHRWDLAVPDQPVTVTGDTARLHQVLANLLTNARNHTPPGTTVTVSLARYYGHALLSVADDGPGIPASLMPEVFERFARGDTSRSRAAGSTGLGLAIVAAVVEAHGGVIDVASAPGRTVFTGPAASGRCRWRALTAGHS
jgi:two-component system OmpR family sensor kinase